MYQLTPTFRFGIIVGITFALYTVVGRFAWEIKGHISVMSHISSFYINYSSSGFSAYLWGSLWAFIDGFIIGVLWSWLRTQLPYSN
ncbi:hypothetical protein [Candidatus Uabimicrobium amorphum]|uniref:Uncharacterized protein n=1 Tax=Uabimicrobium amorphum TaxID=2596890 RepID=A0A5S9ISX5_UABAM|nr:hypothetical protein [Candidatus Uabimicrobium amorphum]BBM87509.1 hypothetical protein UABAM_05921 [Candidatus Uabimicrobium amorphum]